MRQYIEFTIQLYVHSVRNSLFTDTTAGLGNFKEQITASISKLLDDNNLQVCLLPQNTRFIATNESYNQYSC